MRVFLKLVLFLLCLFFGTIMVLHFYKIKKEEEFLLQQKNKLITFHWTNRWGIGNEMFALASTLGVNYMLNNARIVCINKNVKIRSLFNLKKFPACTAEFLTQHLGASTYHELHYAKYDPKVQFIPQDISVVLDRFFQSWKYFRSIPTELRKLFKFHDELLREAANLLDEKMKDATCIGSDCNSDKPILKIGVHVRRKDLNDEHLQKLGYTQATKEYFQRAFAYAKDLFKHQSIVFVVCTDDNDWALEHLKSLENNIVFITTGDPGLDLAILASCDHSIISVGTFGWWSAWLADGTTIYYKEWPRNGTTLHLSTSHEDYFPENWIPL